MQKGRSTALDSVRGIAALFVIFYRSVLYGNDAAASVLVPPIQDLTTPYLWLPKFILTVANGHVAATSPPARAQ